MVLNEAQVKEFKDNGYMVGPMSQLECYMYHYVKEQGLRFELPYQERIKRHGAQLANRMHEVGIDWWEKQLEEYNQKLTQLDGEAEKLIQEYIKQGEEARGIHKSTRHKGTASSAERCAPAACPVNANYHPPPSCNCHSLIACLLPTAQLPSC